MTRLLIHGMQSSGASLFAYWVAQRPGSIGIVDLYNPKLAPPIACEHPTVLKTVVTDRFSIDDHIASFRPHRTILFVRNPYDTFFSLRTKPYAEKSGDMESKFRRMDDLFRQRDRFDRVIFYEDFIADHPGTVERLQGLDWPVSESYYEFGRSEVNLIEFNQANCDWCRENPPGGSDAAWGMGKIRSQGIDPAFASKPIRQSMLERVLRFCPALCEHYGIEPLEGRPSRGITYIAWGRAIPQAERSAETAGKFGIKTCLIAKDYRGDAFDVNIDIDRRPRFPAEKVDFYELSPWDVTLYLDTDTFVLGDLDLGFDMAERHGLCAVIGPCSSVALQWDLPVDPDIPQYNGGVIFHCRDHPAVRGLWPAVQERMKRDVDWESLAGNPAMNDQSALALVLLERGQNPYVLPSVWNLRPQHGMQQGYGPVKIWHFDEPPPEGWNPRQPGFWSLGDETFKVQMERRLEVMQNRMNERSARERERFRDARKKIAKLRQRLKGTNEAPGPVNRPRVFGIGIHKTGTKTLRAALERLGFRHFPHPQLPLLEAALEGDLEKVFKAADRSESFDDWPWPLLYRELDEHYPGSRFVLSLRRNPEVWYDSIVRHAERTGPTEHRRLVYGFEPQGHRDEYIDSYARHADAVREYFAGRPDQLLTVCWEEGDGWKQLCDFLGVPLVEEPFPHENDAEAAEAKLRERRQRGHTADEIRTVCLILGPYRNLTTLTAACLALHPDCAVLNHEYRHIERGGANFLEDRRATSYHEFKKLALHLARRKGSIRRSHAIQGSEVLQQRFRNRHGDEGPTRPRCLVWKESQRVTSELRAAEPALGELWEMAEGLRCLHPIRNPLDCALSNFRHPVKSKTLGIVGRRDPFAVLEAIVEQIGWLARMEALYPDRFFHFVEGELDGSTLAEIANFLEIAPDPDWIADGLETWSVSTSFYAYSDDLIQIYHTLLDRHLDHVPELREKLRAFANPA